MLRSSASLSSPAASPAWWPANPAVPAGHDKSAACGSVVRGLACVPLAVIDQYCQLIEGRGRHRLAGLAALAAPPPADEAEAVEPALQDVAGIGLHPCADVEAEPRAA